MADLHLEKTPPNAAQCDSSFLPRTGACVCVCSRAQLRHVFQTMDTGGDGTINYEDGGSLGEPGGWRLGLAEEG